MKSYLYAITSLLFLWLFLLLSKASIAQTINPKTLIDAKCPCNKTASGISWKNHGEYIKCVNEAIKELIDKKIITNKDKGEYTSAAAKSNCGKEVVIEEQEVQEGTNGVLTLSGFSEQSFNPITGKMVISIAGAQFSNDPKDFIIKLNSSRFLPTDLAITSSTVSFTITLNEGLNRVSFLGSDAGKMSAIKDYNLWAGSGVLDIKVENNDGTLASNSSVKVFLSDDESVIAEGIATAGSISFINMPERTLIINATAPGNLSGSAGTVGGSNVTIKLIPFNAPSNVINNDFSLGTTGWDIGTAPVQIIPHEESSSSTLKSLLAATDQDLLLPTLGEGPQNISRTFITGAGTQNVKIRYRFVTEEVPGGYFGSQYNDYYRIQLRTKTGGLIESELKSMNGLGLEAFDYGSGSTAWKELSIPVSNSGDIIQIDLEVANIADGFLDSYIQVDYVEESKLNISKVELYDVYNTTQEKLQFLSIDENFTFYDGKVRVYGTATIMGASTDKITALTLEVWQGTTKLNSADLVTSAQATVFQLFGSDEKIEITTPVLLFELPPRSPLTENGKVELKIIASSESGGSATKSWGSIPNLRLDKDETKRYFCCNASEGGDAWALPSVYDEAVNIRTNYSNWLRGDISNMNGGDITGHADHEEGREIDIDIPKELIENVMVDRVNSTLANEIVTYIKNTSLVDDILIYWEENDNDELWKLVNTPENIYLINDAKLVKKADHKDHFHIRYSPNAQSNLLQKSISPLKPRIKKITLNDVLIDNIKLYPNPANNQVTVSLQHNNEKLDKIKVIKQIRIKDKFNQIKKQFLYSTGVSSSILYISDLPSSIYYLEVSDGTNIVVVPLTVVK
jgi:hypothetical protein